MIKFIQCVNRKPGMSVADFRNHWREYRDKLRAIAEAIGALKCAECTTLTVEQNLQVMLSRGTTEPFDAVAEIWLENARDAQESLQASATQKMVAELQSYQQDFMDLESSSFFFTSENVLFERD